MLITLIWLPCLKEHLAVCYNFLKTLSSKPLLQWSWQKKQCSIVSSKKYFKRMCFKCTSQWIFYFDAILYIIYHVWWIMYSGLLSGENNPSHILLQKEHSRCYITERLLLFKSTSRLLSSGAGAAATLFMLRRVALCIDFIQNGRRRAHIAMQRALPRRAITFLFSRRIMYLRMHSVYPAAQMRSGADLGSKKIHPRNSSRRRDTERGWRTESMGVNWSTHTAYALMPLHPENMTQTFSWDVPRTGRVRYGFAGTLGPKCCRRKWNFS
jgi:hypothetical protein